MSKISKIYSNRLEENILANLVNEGYSIMFNEYTIESNENSYLYNGSKQFVVRHPYEKTRSYNTIRGARKFIDKNSDC